MIGKRQWSFSLLPFSVARRQWCGRSEERERVVVIGYLRLYELHQMEALLLTVSSATLSPYRIRIRNKPRSLRRNVNVTGITRCAMDASIGGGYANVPKFPRMNVWDPFKRLGVTPDASEEEIRGARNFLLQQYAGHERSVESIEAAYDKIIMASFRERKKSKINLKSKLKKKVEESPPWVKQLISFVEVPPTEIILRRLFLFAFMGAWSVMNSTESGPAFQVALSLGACIYFLNDKVKSIARASILGFGALVVGWVCGSFLVPMIPSVLLQPTWTLELLTSLVSYVFLFVTCTFLK